MAFFACLMQSLDVAAQKLEAVSLEDAVTDNTAWNSSTCHKLDDGRYCPVVKVEFNQPACNFEGGIFEGKKPVFKTNEYWVYMLPGARHLIIKHPSYDKIDVFFDEVNPEIVRLKEKHTYILKLKGEVKKGLESVEKGDASAMLKMAQNYEKGTGSYNKNLQQALEWYEKAAEAGSIEAQEYLAAVLYSGKNGFNTDNNKALRWNAACGKRGNETAILRTAELYKGMSFNNQAIEWYQKYNELHPAKELQMQIAQLHDTSNPNRNKWLKTAADNGHIEAAYELATRLAPTDQQTASTYYQKAVDAGHVMAMNDYGTILMTGKYGFPKNVEKGQALLKRAIDNSSMGTNISQIKTTTDLARYVEQIPSLTNAAKGGDIEAILKLHLIYKAVGDGKMGKMMLLAARYNLGYNLPKLWDYDEHLILRTFSFARNNIIDHRERKSRTIRVYSYPKTEYYNEDVPRKRTSNYEFLMEDLGNLEVTGKTIEEVDKELLTNCKNYQSSMKLVLRAISDASGSSFAELVREMNAHRMKYSGHSFAVEKELPSLRVTTFGYLVQLARDFHDKDAMDLLEKLAREGGNNKKDYKYKYDSWLYGDMKAIWLLPDQLSTAYDVRIVKALIDYRSRTHEGNWKKEVKWLEEWLLTYKNQESKVEFVPMIRQLQEESLLWSEQIAQNAPAISEKNRKASEEIKLKKQNEIQSAVLAKCNAKIREFGKKKNLTTLEAGGVAFNVIFERKGRIGNSGNFVDHDFHVMVTPVTRALWNAVMGNPVLSEKDYNLCMSGNYLNWLLAKKYYGNIWKDAKYKMKPEDVSPKELDLFLAKLNEITKKKFRIISSEESELLKSRAQSKIMKVDNAEDYHTTIFSRDFQTILIRLAY